MYLERLKGGRNTKYLPELSFHLKVNIKNLINTIERHRFNSNFNGLQNSISLMSHQEFKKLRQVCKGKRYSVEQYRRRHVCPFSHYQVNKYTERDRGEDFRQRSVEQALQQHIDETVITFYIVRVEKIKQVLQRLPPRQFELRCPPAIPSGSLT